MTERTVPVAIARSTPTVLEPAVADAHGPAIRVRTWTRSIHAVASNRGALAVVDQAILSAASLLMVLAIGRGLSQEALGMYHLAIGCFYFVQSFAEQTIHLPYLIRRPRISPDDAATLRGSILIHNALVTAAGMVALWCAGAWLTWISDAHALGAALLVLGGALPMMMARDFVHNLLHSHLEQGRAVVFDSLVFMLQVSVIGTMYATGHLNIAGVFVALGATWGIVAGAWLVRHRQWFQPRIEHLGRHWSESWSIGRWSLGSYLVGSGAPIVLPWILAASHGVSAAGRLAACMTLVGLAQMFLRGSSKYLAPASAQAFGEGGAGALNQILWRFTLLYAAMVTPLAIVLGAFGADFLGLAFGPDYAGTGITMLLLSVSFWFQSFDMVVGNGLYALARSEANFWADCARCAVTIVVSVLAIPLLGVPGVAWALMLGTIGGLIARGLLYARSSRAASNAEPAGECRETSPHPTTGV